MKNKFYSVNDLEKMFNGIEIRNAYIKYVDLNVIGHFGNIVTLDIPIQSGVLFVNPFAGISSTLNCGIIIRTLFEMLDIHEEDGKKISEIRDVPCRIGICNGTTIVVGNFMKDEFVIVSELFENCKNYLKNLKL